MLLNILRIQINSQYKTYWLFADTMEPVLGAGFSFVLLNERWGPGAWIGAALIILSSLTTQLHDMLPSKESQKE